MLSPFSCPHCHRPLGHGKPAVTPNDFDVHLDCSALASIASFTALLKDCQIDWLGQRYWHYGADPTIQDDAYKRAAVFSIYHQIIPNALSGAHLVQTPVHLYDAGTSKSEDLFDDQDNYRNRERIFSRIKRYIARHLLTRHGDACAERTRNAMRIHFEPMYPDMPVCPLWFGYYLWEYHFMELNTQPIYLGEQSTHLRPAIRAWPCETQVSDKAWRMFCIWAFLSYVEIAYVWNRLVESDEQGRITHESLLKALGQLRLDMVPDWQAFPSNISFFQLKPPGAENPSCFVVSGNISASYHRLLKGESYADCAS